MKPVREEPPEPAADPVEAEAAAWLARRDRGLTPEEAVEFARWRDRDPRHEAAVAMLDGVWCALDDLGGLKSGTDMPASAPLPAQRRPFFHGWPAWALAASIAIMVAGLLWQRQVAPAVQVARHATPLGEQRTITLADGSTLQLNTGSAVEVSYSASERRVRLQEGEVFAQVVPDAARPFTVEVPGVEARVVGTAFSLRRHADTAELLVEEGRVRFGAPGDPDSIVAAARQHASFSPGRDAMPRVTVLDAATVERRLAWRSGRLNFKDTPLAEVAAEFNRYHRIQLVMADAATGAWRFGGAFEIANVDGFVRLLDEIEVVRRDAGTIVLRLKR